MDIFTTLLSFGLPTVLVVFGGLFFSSLFFDKLFDSTFIPTRRRSASIVGFITIILGIILFVFGSNRSYDNGVATGERQATDKLQPTITTQNSTITELETTITNTLSTTSKPSTSILVSSTFNTDTDQWMIIGGGTGPDFRATGGYSGGYIGGKEIIGDNLADWYYLAPSKFLGDSEEAYNGILFLALFQSDLTDTFTSTDDIILISDHMQLTYDLPNPGRAWTEYAVWLNAAAGWKTGDGSLPTEGEMRQVLSELKELRIRGEYRTGDDSGGLDSVMIIKHP
jgi:hypothetical protein